MNVSFELHSHCAKFRNPPKGYRRRSRHRSPSTPPLHWKFHDEKPPSWGGGGVALSARKLAAGLWQLRLLTQPCAGHVNQVLPFGRASREYVLGTKHLQQSPLPACSQNHKSNHRHASSLPYPKSAMEGATKWDTRCLTTSTEASCFCSHPKFLEGQFDTLSIVSAMQAGLAQAQLRIRGLENELQSSKKKLEHLLRRLREERNSWQEKYNKMCAVTDRLKDEISVGRKRQKRIEIVNSKLVKELADSKSSEKQLMRDYEEEKRARELMEEVCNELAEKIEEDKTEMEVLKSETFKICGELEEERRMLQLAKDLSEECVRMKLVDARLALEYKYSQMNNLVADLELFLRSRSENLDEMDLRKTEVIMQAVKSVKLQDMKEIEYVPLQSGSIFSISGENQQKEANERKLARHIEDQGSRHLFEGSDCSAIRAKEIQLASRSKMECNEKVTQDFPNTEISEVFSSSGEQPEQKTYSVCKLRRSLTSFGKFCKITSDEVHGTHSNGTVSIAGTTSPRRKSVEGCSRLRQRDLVGRLFSSDSENPHITRGMKGFVEWPRGIQKKRSKVKCMKSMIESQRNQLHNLRK